MSFGLHRFYWALGHIPFTNQDFTSQVSLAERAYDTTGTIHKALQLCHGGLGDHSSFWWSDPSSGIEANASTATIEERPSSGMKACQNPICSEKWPHLWHDRPLGPQQQPRSNPSFAKEALATTATYGGATPVLGWRPMQAQQPARSNFSSGMEA